MITRATVLIFLATTTVAYPWVVDTTGIETSILSSRNQIKPRDSPSCPFNANHEPGSSSSDDFPYLGAKNGMPGTGKGGIQVPAPGDTAHAYKEPDPRTDIRGPCPGLYRRVRYELENLPLTLTL